MNSETPVLTCYPELPRRARGDGCVGGAHQSARLDSFSENSANQAFQPHHVDRGVFLLDVVLHGLGRNSFSGVQRFQGFFHHDRCGRMSRAFPHGRSV